MKTSTAALISAVVTAFHVQCVQAEPEIYTSVCDDPAAGQTFYLQETIDEGRHKSLEVAKVDLMPGKGVYRILVFSAVPDGIKATDSSLSTALNLTFSSNSDQYELIAGATVALATEGETGPIIEEFAFRHANGQELKIVERSQPLACRTAGGD